MKLYINNKLAHLEKELEPNMTFRFQDTYNPSAVKTSYSKTVTLPDCPENAAIFGTLQARYPFELWNEAGILEKGYCTLDNVKKVGVNKTYNVTLYGGLGDFFYNLKGDESNPKSLADLLWTDVTGLTPELENSSSIIAWSKEYVYESWTDPQGMSDVFRPVPCILDSKNFQADKTIIPYDTLFLEDEQEEEKDPWVGEDGTQAVVVEAEDNTCYGKQDFRVEQMLLGVKYQEIIKACCKPENNGGYSVTLDPDFFTEINPYWTNMFLLKKTPALDYDYLVNSSSYDNFSASLIRVGNYQGSGQSSAVGAVVPQGSTDVWEASGQYLNLRGDINLVNNVLSWDLCPYFTADVSSLLPTGKFFNPEGAFLQFKGTVQVRLHVQNVDTGNIKTFLEEYSPSDGWPCLYVDEVLGDGSTHKYQNPNIYLPPSSFKGDFILPEDWTKIRIYYQLYRSLPNDDCEVIYGLGMSSAGYGHLDVSADVVLPTSKNQDSNLPNYEIKIDTQYLGGDFQLGDILYTKKQLLGGTKSPFDYLVWFTKMFNLRFYMNPGTREIEILTPQNYLKRFPPIDIQDRVCYDRDYLITSKIIDEGYLLFNLTPDENETVKEYKEQVGEGLLDLSYPVGKAETRNSKEYLSPGLKIGTQARIVGTLAARLGVQAGSEGKYFYGFNQQSPYSVIYKSGSLGTVSEEKSLNYDVTSQRYDFLQVNNLDDVVVMYSGLKGVPFNIAGGGPAIISQTSTTMLATAGGPCYLSGVEGSEGQEGSLLDSEYILTYRIPHYGIVPSVENYNYGLTYSNVDYKSIIATGNIYDNWFRDFIQRVYDEPLVVDCYVRLVNPELRRLYWFDNNYWILTEVSNYNFKDEPVKCRFIRYKYDA